MQGAAANGWPVVNPEDVVEEVRREAGGARFSCGQHDAHDFLLFLLNLCPEQPAHRTERGRGDDARAAREPGGGMAGGEGRAAHAQRPSEEHRPGWSVWPHTDGACAHTYTHTHTGERIRSTDGACECTKASNVEEVMQDGGGLRSLVEGEVVRFDSYDGLPIPGILYKPREASAENPAPALVWVHGGPGGQSRKGYSAMIQHLVNHGYAVYQINNRGSSGYGKTFYHLDDLKHGEADLGDVVASRAFLASYDWIDGERVGIIGGSYGGYMVAAALAFKPQAFDVGINIFGVTNWLRTLESIPPWWGAFRDSLYAELGDPATDTDRLTAISPLFHAENIVKPLLVVQGANDPRVLQVESDELVDEVRANNVPVEYVLFEDEGHGFRKRVNRITASEAYLQFLNTHL